MHILFCCNQCARGKVLKFSKWLGFIFAECAVFAHSDVLDYKSLLTPWSWEVFQKIYFDLQIAILYDSLSLSKDVAIQQSSKLQVHEVTELRKMTVFYQSLFTLRVEFWFWCSRVGKFGWRGGARERRYFFHSHYISSLFSFIRTTTKSPREKKPFSMA